MRNNFGAATSESEAMARGRKDTRERKSERRGAESGPEAALQTAATQCLTAVPVEEEQREAHDENHEEDHHAESDAALRSLLQLRDAAVHVQSAWRGDDKGKRKSDSQRVRGEG